MEFMQWGNSTDVLFSKVFDPRQQFAIIIRGDVPFQNIWFVFTACKQYNSTLTSDITLANEKSIAFVSYLTYITCKRLKPDVLWNRYISDLKTKSIPCLVWEYLSVLILDGRVGGGMMPGKLSTTETFKSPVNLFFRLTHSGQHHINLHDTQALILRIQRACTSCQIKNHESYNPSGKRYDADQCCWREQCVFKVLPPHPNTENFESTICLLTTKTTY